MTLPPGLTASPLDVDDPAQVDAAARVRIAGDLAAVGWTNETRESVLAALVSPIAWPEQHRLVHDRDGAVGLLIAERISSRREVFLDVAAVGAMATGIERALIEEGLAAVRRLAAADDGCRPVAEPYLPNDGIWQVVTAGWDVEEDYFAVLDALGFRPIRRFWRMRWDLAAGAPAHPPAPAGTTRRVVDGDEDRRLLHRLFEESFAEHFGAHARPFEVWIEELEGSAGVDPSRWWIAEVNGMPAGLCILDDSKASFGDGYVRTLGVVPSARGHGVARWLLACAAADAVARGRTGLALAVDGENTTGATDLYESVGFVIRQVIDVWCCPIMPRDDG